MNLRSLMLVCIVVALPAAAADVYRCTDAAGTVTYADAPCGKDAAKVPMLKSPNPDGLDQYRGKSPLGPEGTKLDVPRSVVDECFDGYRVYARDPTTAKNVGWNARITPSGIAALTVTGVFTNKSGGPDRHYLWCKLTNDLQIDKAATEPRQRDFWKEQNDLRLLR